MGYLAFLTLFRYKCRTQTYTPQNITYTRLYTVESRRYEGSCFGIYIRVYIPQFSKFSFFIINFFAASRQPSLMRKLLP